MYTTLFLRTLSLLGQKLLKRGKVTLSRPIVCHAVGVVEAGAEEAWSHPPCQEAKTNTQVILAGTRALGFRVGLSTSTLSRKPFLDTHRCLILGG